MLLCYLLGLGTGHEPNPLPTDQLPDSPDVIKNDLTPLSDKPLWPLSCYGPTKHEPNLLTGLDESPEELRVRAFTANRAGNHAEYVSWIYITSVSAFQLSLAQVTYEASKISAAEQVFTVPTIILLIP